ncbi:glycine zipper 2TM domain-containing protein [Lysobacter sp. CFH 32150]|uniref:glycine zipper 2TM domain-containing protein n=1 Tax=Lysobacter sp. CFH 32150 TaxID=2927128 RepID=UPI001FA6BE39|nr:glycine zipper 2TM domain-containing protein [Lysobacter sp. CFH 32150]MCI4568795.1 glycine zipper 2TM domain-containing protein [Lysobacter sp. CFH 32150]
MKRLSATLLALGLAAAAGMASAQTYGTYGNNAPYYRNSGYTNTNQVYPDRYGNTNSAIYDYARVIRVDPVIDSRYGYGNTANQGQNCYERTTVEGNDGYYGNDPYRRDDYYGNDPYRRDNYGRDPYYPQQSGYGTNTGRTMATVIGGIAGAVLGSKVGGGTGTYAATAIGTMVGGMAGRQIYESSQRNRQPRTGTVRICDPVPARSGYGSYPVNEGSVTGYDVTYEYAGRQFTSRTNYHPGDRIRVRVDVRPE